MVFIPSTTLGSKSIFWHQFILIRLPGSFLSWVIFVHSCVNPMHHSTCKDRDWNIQRKMSIFVNIHQKKRLSLFIESLVYIRSSMSINYSALIVACRKGISIHFTEENMDLNSHSNRPHQIGLKKWCSFCNLWHCHSNQRASGLHIKMFFEQAVISIWWALSGWNIIWVGENEKADQPVTM